MALAHFCLLETELVAMETLLKMAVLDGLHQVMWALGGCGWSG